MTDYVVTKENFRKTGELPDRVTLVLPAHIGWRLIYQIQTQLEQCHPQITVEIYGTVEKAGVVSK